MKRSIICLALAAMLALSLQGAAFASVPSSGTAENGSILTNVQYMLARTQQEMTQAQQREVLEAASLIERLMDEQQMAGGHLNTAKMLKDAAASEGIEIEMPADLADYMRANGLAYDTTGDDLLMTADEWDVAVSSLQDHLLDLGQRTQQATVYLWDFLGQRGSSIDNANSQTFTSLARNQSMYGDSEVGLAVTALVVGLALGCTLTLAVQRLRGRKDAA